MSEIKPALTVDEWVKLDNHYVRVGERGVQMADQSRYLDLSDPHGTAALCLHGQDFGFTWEDVKLLRYETPGTDPAVAGSAARRARFLNLAARIASLLPPRE